MQRGAQRRGGASASLIYPRASRHGVGAFDSPRSPAFGFRCGCSTGAVNLFPHGWCSSAQARWCRTALQVLLPTFVTHTQAIEYTVYVKLAQAVLMKLRHPMST